MKLKGLILIILKNKADSIYLRDNLDSHGFNTNNRIEERVDKIDRYVIYSDYHPRLSGSARYAGGNLPQSVNVAYPLLDDDKRLYYRDRRYVFNGIEVPDEFYSPDYTCMNCQKSQQTIFAHSIGIRHYNLMQMARQTSRSGITQMQVRFSYLQKDSRTKENSCMVNRNKMINPNEQNKLLIWIFFVKW